MPNTSFIDWMALVCFITFFVQKIPSLVGARHFKLSGMLSSWLRARCLYTEHIKCNIFLQPCNFEKSCLGWHQCCHITWQFCHLYIHSQTELMEEVSNYFPVPGSRWRGRVWGERGWRRCRCGGRRPHRHHAGNVGVGWVNLAYHDLNKERKVHPQCFVMRISSAKSVSR